MAMTCMKDLSEFISFNGIWHCFCKDNWLETTDLWKMLLQTSLSFIDDNVCNPLVICKDSLISLSKLAYPLAFTFLQGWNALFNSNTEYLGANESSFFQAFCCLRWQDNAFGLWFAIWWGEEGWLLGGVAGWWVVTWPLGGMAGWWVAVWPLEGVAGWWVAVWPLEGVTGCWVAIWLLGGVDEELGWFWETVVGGWVAINLWGGFLKVG